MNNNSMLLVNFFDNCFYCENEFLFEDLLKIDDSEYGEVISCVKCENKPLQKHSLLDDYE